MNLILYPNERILVADCPIFKLFTISFALPIATIILLLLFSI
nr:MAG TPA: hypothetical protein [Caudoviricetes sp.]